MMRKYVIVGSGAAGMSAAENIRRLDPSADLRVVTNDPNGYYSRPGLAYYLTGDIPRAQLFPFPASHWPEIGIHWCNGRAESLDPAAHALRINTGELLAYDRLLLATGAEAVLPDVPGIALDGVMRLDSLEDADRILRMARRGQTAVVTGGGITALELVEGLLARGMKVQYLLRGDRYWGAVLDPAESRIVEQRLKDHGVIIHYNMRLVEVVGRGGRVTGVLVNNGTIDHTIPCSLFTAAIGVRPRVALAKQAGLTINKGIRTSETMQTSDPDIYAAGDVAEVRDPHNGEYLLDSLWIPAIEMGAAAGASMTGHMTVYRKAAPINVTRLAGLITTIIGQVSPSANAPCLDRDLRGIMRGDSQTWRIHPETVVTESGSGDNRLRLYLRGSRAAGALLMGDQRLSLTLQKLVRSERSLDDLHPILLEPGARLYDLLEQYG
jgi:NADPH-dependent 2,4-dienoyl-CoA reductase/sulfur reductase-like enzyme